MAILNKIIFLVMDGNKEEDKDSNYHDCIYGVDPCVFKHKATK
ncbi:MAG: hypothetical protein ACPKQO_08470 [Nitrososphaeraceae archaeon]